ncbi:MAG: MFS transporter [Spirochaetota bacterium]
MQQVQSLPLSKKIIYSLGQFGWSLTSYGVINLVTQFYMPAQTEQGLTYPLFIMQSSIIFGITIIGLITFSGRIFDAITDPIIAGLSDRSTSKLGRRRKFLLISSVPFALLSFLVFTPPAEGISTVNIVWLTGTILLFYLAMTMYVAPYFALISELGHTPKERLDLSTFISITWALGFAVGSQSLTVKGALFQNALGFEPVAAFQLTMATFAIIGLILMLMPVAFINERKYSEFHVSKEGSFQAVKTAFSNKSFLFFTLSDLTYWLSLTFIQIGMQPYYVTTLLKLKEEVVGTLMLIMFGCSFLFYVPINFIAKKVGKKKIVIAGFIAFSLSFAFVMIMGKIPFIPPFIQGVIAMVWSSIPIAIFGILPNAIIADVAEADGIKTGNYKAGIFYAARTFMQKLGQSGANLLFPSIILLGYSIKNPIGLRVTGFVAFLFCIIGLLLFLKYDEKYILSILSSKEELSEDTLKVIKE